MIWEEVEMKVIISEYSPRHLSTHQQPREIIVTALKQFMKFNQAILLQIITSWDLEHKRSVWSSPAPMVHLLRSYL